LKVALLPVDPYESAKIAGLRYVTDASPGIIRRRAGTGFTYVAPSGEPVRDRDVLKRIRSLVIPPAWTNVWICPSPSGHIQAIGMDARGRKQYRYHPLYRQVRDATKFTRMVAFGLTLPKIRERVAADLKLAGLPKNKVVATVVRLLERTSIRVGNEEYRKQNESFGLTTLRNRHVEIEGRTLHFRFKGKSGQLHDIALTDRKLARIVGDCQDLPGYELFQYVNTDGGICRVTSDDVNQYLHEITGEEFTAKDFRTWNGSREAAIALEALGPADSDTAARKSIVDAIKVTASRLGNRPATCRKYYVHPAVLDAYTDGSLFEVMRESKPQGGEYGLAREEVAIMQLLALHVPKAGRVATPDSELSKALRKSVARVRVAEIQVVPSSNVVNLA
jgi:DNA topoisomerase-1